MVGFSKSEKPKNYSFDEIKQCLNLGPLYLNIDQFQNGQKIQNLNTQIQHIKHTH